MELLNKLSTIKDAYAEMVSRYPYRVLSSYNYDWDERPSRSQRCSLPAPVTDSAAESYLSSRSQRCSLPAPVTHSAAESHLSTEPRMKEDFFSGISTIDGHRIFLEKLIEAKKFVDINSKIMTVKWRGFSTNVSPNHPPYTPDLLLEKLLQAIVSIVEVTPEEKEVSYI